MNKLGFGVKNGYRWLKGITPLVLLLYVGLYGRLETTYVLRVKQYMILFLLCVMHVL
jgi:hypothetical protein